MKLPDDLRTGDLLLVRGSGWFSKLIEWDTGEYSHVAPVLIIQAEGHVGRIPTVVEAVAKIGVRMVPIDWYLTVERSAKESVDWFALRNDAGIDRIKFADCLLRSWGQKFTPLSVLAWRFLAPLRWLKRTFGIGPSVIRARPWCSYLAVEAALMAGYTPDKPLPPEDSTPTMVSKFPAWQRRGSLTEMMGLGA